MSVAIITGSAGLIGSEASVFFAEQGFEIIGIDNDMRQVFFGSEASTLWQRERLQKHLKGRYTHLDIDIRDLTEIMRVFKKYGKNTELIVHTAAQPSHDWAARDPQTDFGVNANGTLNLLEATRVYSPDATFVFTSTNKVYGDLPNRLPLIEKDLRWEIDPNHKYAIGIREDMSIDQSLHSLFGASKVAADILVQEYGRYFGINSTCLRGGCLTGPNHSGTQLHGFLAYLMRCAVTGRAYTIFGYKGKQVRDNIHSVDFIKAIFEFFKSPRKSEVYNLGGGRFSNCSILEAISMCEQISGKPMNYTYDDTNRIGDHIWYISSLEKFMDHYPSWNIDYDVPAILYEIFEQNAERWAAEVG